MRLLVVLPVLAVMLGAKSVHSQKCPNVDPASGYPVAATFEGATASDSAWLAAVARASAYRWKVPSRRRDTYVGWERVRTRLLPPEPRWADDWSPEAKHRAGMRVMLFRDGRKPRAEITRPSGDKRFDETLESIVDDPMPASPSLPALPATIAADSVVVLLTLGEIPAGVQGTVRFAAAQTRIELDRSSFRVAPVRRPGEAPPPFTVKYDVRENGTIDESSIEFIGSAHISVEMAIRDGLRGARFKAPTSNCRPIAQTVVQTFGR